MLFCDVTFIVSDEESAKKACNILKNCLSDHKQNKIMDLYVMLYNNDEVPLSFEIVNSLIVHFRNNRKFLEQKEMRVMVAANMSAGKSTLINALIGKPVARISQEACTATLYYLHNKPFEDGRIHLSAFSLNLNATSDDLSNIGSDVVPSIALYFRRLSHLPNRYSGS